MKLNFVPNWCVDDGCQYQFNDAEIARTTVAARLAKVHKYKY